MHDREGIIFIMQKTSSSNPMVPIALPYKTPKSNSCNPMENLLALSGICGCLKKVKCGITNRPELRSLVASI